MRSARSVGLPRSSALGRMGRQGGLDRWGCVVTPTFVVDVVDERQLVRVPVDDGGDGRPCEGTGIGRAFDLRLADTVAGYAVEAA